MTKNLISETVRQVRDRELNKQSRHEAINRILFKLPGLINNSENLDELFAAVHTLLGEIMDTTNFYVALYRRDSDSITFPFCVDKVDGHYPPIDRVSKTASLTAEVIRTGQPLMTTKQETLDGRAKSPYKPPLCTPSAIWLGVPLKTNEELLGVLAVQNYEDQSCYDQLDFNVLVTVADLVALAIAMHRKTVELSETDNELKLAREKVHAMQGLLPLCPSCQTHRKDKEYLETVGRYIQQYQISDDHSYLCPICLKEKFPELAMLNSGNMD